MALWGNVDQAADKPQYLTTAQKTDVAGISVTEAQVQGNKDKGVAHAGWVTNNTYTDQHGRTRNKTEVLVAMSSISGDDATDDTTIGANS